MPWAKGRPSNPVYYTREYRAAKAAAVKAFRQGDPCWHCGRAMYAERPSSLHLEHSGSPATRDFTARGLTHPGCNVRDGARRGRARQNVQVTALRW